MKTSSRVESWVLGDDWQIKCGGAAPALTGIQRRGRRCHSLSDAAQEQAHRVKLRNAVRQLDTEKRAAIELLPKKVMLARLPDFCAAKTGIPGGPPTPDAHDRVSSPSDAPPQDQAAR